MSVRLMSAIWDMDFSPVEKLILLALADWANDDGVAWPSITQLAKKTGCGERTVQRTLRAAEVGGLLERNEVKGRGCSYRLNPRHAGTPATQSPVPETTDTPATLAPNTPVNIIPQKASPSSVTRTKRKTTVPSNFHPVVNPGSITAKAMADWPPGELEEQVEHFIDRHTVTGTLSADWQASWRTWVKNWKKFNGNRTGLRKPNGQPDLRGPRPDPAIELARRAAAELAAENPGSDQGDRGGDWPSLPSYLAN